MIVTIDGLDRIGVVKDVQDYELPINAWTDARNVRARDGKVEKFKGHDLVFNPLTVPPYWLLHTINSSEESIWVYAGLTQVYAIASGVHTQITRAGGGTPYNATEVGLWNGGILQGVPILNNGVDVPQFWNPPINVATDLADLTNWPAGYTASMIRPHREFLVAMDLTEAGQRYMHRVRISHPADPGGVPPSWDDLDPTTEAIKKDLTDTQNGKMVDGGTLGNQFIVYKEHATHAFQYIGGVFKWRNYQLYGNLGILTHNCHCSFEDQQQQQMHAVFSGEDFVVHNGIQANSIVDRRQRRWLINNISRSNAEKSFVFPNVSEDEVWLCIPLEEAVFPNHALVWNIQTNALTQRDLPETSFIALGKVPLVGDTWDSDSQVWDADVSPWDTFAHPSFIHRMIGARPGEGELYHLDLTEQFEGISFEAYVERTGLTIYGKDNSGKPLQDIDQAKIVRSIYPSVEGTGSIEVQLSTQQVKGGPTTLSPVKVFTPGQRRPCVDFGISCKLFGVKFRSSGDETWRLASYGVDVEPLGFMG